MFRNIIRTSDDKVLTLLRLVLAIVVFPHGAQKVLGWFGGFGFSGTYGFLTQQMHIPAPLAVLVFAASFSLRSDSFSGSWAEWRRSGSPSISPSRCSWFTFRMASS
jgi:hypothetical protein